MKQIIITLLLVLSIFSISANTQQKPQTWEYKLDDKCYEKKVNDLAAQGWELITIDSFTYSQVTGLTCAFRRAK